MGAATEAALDALPAPRPDPGVSPAAPLGAEAGAPIQTPAQDAAIPAPPPGEATSPDLPPVESGAAQALGQEIVLSPDGKVIPPADQKPRVFSPADGGGGFANAAGTTVNRLPMIGAGQPDSAAVSDAAPSSEAAPVETPAATKPLFQRPPGAESAAAPPPELADATPPEEPAIRRFAAAAPALDGRAPMAVALIDVGEQAGGLDPQTIAGLGLPATIVIDPSRPGAAEAAALYRARGLEVAVLASGLPAWATAQDVATALESWRVSMPEAIGVVEPPRPTFQNDRMRAQQIVAGLKETGEGLVTQAAGLNAAAQVARSAGVPEAQVWRVLDAGRENGAAVSRALARAAFEAERKGALVVMLSAWPESVAGLTDWASGGQDKTALVPVSSIALNAAPGAVN